MVTLAEAKLVGTGALILSIGFALGTIYSNWTYDYFLLWVNPTPDDMFQAAVEHYKLKAQQPNFLHHVLHFFLGLGIVGLIVKLYRPSESNTLFDGGSLLLVMAGVIFYIANLRPAANSVTTGNWNDIDEKTGVRLFSATQVLIVLCFLGVIGLQLGQWWAERDVFAPEQPTEVQEPEKGASAPAEAKEPATADVKASGASKSNTKARNRKL